MMKNLINNRILIIGSNGMLGQRLTEFYKLSGDVELLTCSVEDKSFIKDVEYRKLDITDVSEVKSVVMDFFPDEIINTAAFTNVDGAEKEKELAWKINVGGVKNIARYAQAIDAHIVHISTDYVFDGKNGPYSETDKPNPIGYYGRTKLASENELKVSGARFSVVRTNVLYGPAKFGRPDFVKWVVSSLRNGTEIKIVTDQFGNPTFIDDLVFGIDAIVERQAESTYNIGGKDFLTRFQFTMKIAEFFELDKSLIKPIITADLHQLAARPLKSGLVISKAKSELGYNPHSVNDALKIMQKELGL
jgi:dTDP-4-dehydrorhamnose reductase